MFKKWLAIFKKDTLMDHAYQRSFKMLDITLEMFREARDSLRNRDDNEIDLGIKDKDKEVNKYEREVRRKVFNHLALQGAAELSSGLALVSIIIDMERIGDYTKNMVELALDHPGRLHGGQLEESLVLMEEAVEDNFLQTKKCFLEGDDVLALALLEKYAWLAEACDKGIRGIVQDNDTSLRPGDAAALALYIRFLKRVNSHLRNITTSVINPFDRIGFNPKTKR